jgi:hypothetical protein
LALVTRQTQHFGNFLLCGAACVASGVRVSAASNAIGPPAARRTKQNISGFYREKSLSQLPL